VLRLVSLETRVPVVATSSVASTDPCVSELELAQHVVRHVVLGQRVDDQVLIAR